MQKHNKQAKKQQKNLQLQKMQAKENKNSLHDTKGNIKTAAKGKVNGTGSGKGAFSFGSLFGGGKMQQPETAQETIPYLQMFRDGICG